MVNIMKKQQSDNIIDFSEFVIEKKENIEENNKRISSVKKMIKNYVKSKKTNYRLLLNHIIIIQNDLGASKCSYVLEKEFSKKIEISYLNSFLYFLKYVEYTNVQHNMCYDLYKKIAKEVN